MAIERRGKPRAASIARVSEFVDENLAEPLTVRQLAGLTGLSEFHFIRALLGVEAIMKDGVGNWFSMTQPKPH